MSNFDTVVLDGEMGLFTKVREGDLPYYTGATEVTPSDQTQTLPTADTIVTSNITINPIPDIDLEEVQVTYTPDEEGQTDTITPSTGYAGISEVEVTIEPIDTDYVGSGIARNDSDDLTASGATITAPAGYYENDATKTIASGTAGTPTATKGTVSNHSVSVTPSVTNTTGYITGGTHTGTAVTVSASELVSGDKSITANGTNIDVAEYATVSVAVPGDTPTLETKSVSYTPTEYQQTAQITASTGYDGLEEVDITVGAISSSYVGSAIDRRDSTDLSASGATVTAPAGYYASAATKSVASGTAGTPSATKGAVSNHSVSVTPSVTNTAGYISGGTISGTAVTVDVTELESGTKSITENGTGISVSGYSAVDVNVSGGGGGSADLIDVLAGSVSGAFSNSDITKLKNRAFAENGNMTSISLPNLIRAEQRIFENCTKCATFYMPKLETCNNWCFAGAGSNTNTDSIILPILNNSDNLFATFENSIFTAIILPTAQNIGGSCFSGSSSLLTAVDLRSVTQFAGTNTFKNRSGLSTIILGGSSVASLSYINSFDGTPFASGGSGGTIYIPKALYDHLGDGTSYDYKAATNWSTIDGYGTITWAKIEGSYYETHYADGTLIPTS